MSDIKVVPLAKHLTSMSKVLSRKISHSRVIIQSKESEDLSLGFRLGL